MRRRLIDPLRGRFGALGGHEPVEVRAVRELVGGAGCVGGQTEE